MISIYDIPDIPTLALFLFVHIYIYIYTYIYMYICIYMYTYSHQMPIIAHSSTAALISSMVYGFQSSWPLEPWFHTGVRTEAGEMVQSQGATKKGGSS